jgi:hypothetical protein
MEIIVARFSSTIRDTYPLWCLKIKRLLIDCFKPECINPVYSVAYIDTISDTKAGRKLLQTVLNDVMAMYQIPLHEILGTPITGHIVVGDRMPTNFDGVEQVRGMLKVQGITDAASRQRAILLGVEYSKIDLESFLLLNDFEQDKHLLLFTSDLGLQILYCRNQGKNGSIPIIKDLENSPSCVLHFHLRVAATMDQGICQDVADDEALSKKEKEVMSMLLINYIRYCR